MKIKLSYFKRTGKWYADGEYETPNSTSFTVVIDDVRRMVRNGCLPGLMKLTRCQACSRVDQYNFIVLVEVPGDGPQRLVIPGMFGA